MFNLTLDQLLPYIGVALTAATGGALGTLAIYRALWRRFQGTVSSPLLGAMLVSLICIPLLVYVASLLFHQGGFAALVLAAYWPSAFATLWLDQERRFERTRSIQLWVNRTAEVLIAGLRAKFGDGYLVVPEACSRVSIDDPGISPSSHILVMAKDGTRLAIVNFVFDDFSIAVHYPQTTFVSCAGKVETVVAILEPRPDDAFMGYAVEVVVCAVKTWMSDSTSRAAAEVAAG